jgi:hypothetical protein
VKEIFNKLKASSITKSSKEDLIAVIQGRIFLQNEISAWLMCDVYPVSVRNSLFLSHGMTVAQSASIK